MGWVKMTKYNHVPDSAKESKPLLRGQFHHAGFYIFTIIGIFVFLKAKTAHFAYATYIISLLAVYGTSATFHVINWKSKKAEDLMQKLDHANIFFLIAGTYTPVCVACLPFHENWVRFALMAVWIIAICGIIKCIVWQNPPKVLNVSFYFICGLSIVPNLPQIAKIFDPATTAIFIVGGVLYLIGGTIYGLEYPDPYPDVLGYHEIFHILTIIANLCFFIPIYNCIT